MNYEVLSVYLSNVLINKEIKSDGYLQPFRKLNIEVKFNLEEMQDLRATVNTEEIANDFAETMKNFFMEKFDTHRTPETKDTKKFSIEVKELENKERNGWYEIYKQNSE